MISFFQSHLHPHISSCTAPARLCVKLNAGESSDSSLPTIPLFRVQNCKSLTVPSSSNLPECVGRAAAPLARCKYPVPFHLQLGSTLPCCRAEEEIVNRILPAHADENEGSAQGTLPRWCLICVLHSASFLGQQHWRFIHTNFSIHIAFFEVERCLEFTMRGKKLIPSTHTCLSSVMYFSRAHLTCSKISASYSTRY